MYIQLLLIHPYAIAKLIEDLTGGENFKVAEFPDQ